MALDHLREDLGREPSRAAGRGVSGPTAGSAYSARSSPTRSDHGEISPIPSGRVAELEARLRRIAAELKAAGVIDNSDTLPPAPDYPQLAELTGRQREILVRLLNAQRVSVIAAELYLSPRTVRNHLTIIFSKFDVHSQAELLAVLRRRPRWVGHPAKVVESGDGSEERTFAHPSAINTGIIPLCPPRRARPSG